MSLPVRDLPERPDLEHLRGQAREWLRAARSGDPAALELLTAFDGAHPVEPSALKLADAQRVIARSYGLASWPALRRHVAVIVEFSRFPEPADPTDDTARADGGTESESTDRFLRLACLTYTDAPEGGPAAAARMLARSPGLARTSVHTAAATGDAEALARMLREDPGAVGRDGGPFGWEPLLYLTYARLPSAAAGDPVASARVLLEAGADPNAGFLWRGFSSPFTALTGAFGGGERGESPHRDAVALARLLLDAGADPNDNQVLYNRAFRDDDSHLEVLFGYGVGVDRPSPWRDRLGATYPSPYEMLTEQLRVAADHGFTERARLLLAHGVDPDGRGYHPIYGGALPYELAVRTGHPEIAEMLAAAGARTAGVDDVDLLVSRWLTDHDSERDPEDAAADGAAMPEPTPDDVDRARRRHPDALVRSVRNRRIGPVRRLLSLGFDPSDASTGRTALHEAVLAGDNELVSVLLDAGADLTVEDAMYHSTPAGWARHFGNEALAERLEAGSAPE